MPRKPRFNLPGFSQHVIQRGNNRAPCFLNDADNRRYLEYLGITAHEHACQIHAYVLMTNHVHVLVTPTRAWGISGMMQSLGRRYVHYFNTTHQRTGTLWEGRYKASLIDSDAYLFTCMRYIELNPVRAGLVDLPEKYPWSSYHANAGYRKNHLLFPHSLYSDLGATTTERQMVYRSSFGTALDDPQIQGIRDALNQEQVLGQAPFVRGIEAMTRRQIRPGVPGRPRLARLEEEGGPYHSKGILEKNPL